jgi:type IV pilus assembly protein PilY1
MHRHALIAAGLGLLLSGAASRADDIELYVGAAQAQTPESYPNVLIIIDTSGSMNDETGSGQSRLEVVKQVANELLDTLEHVNVGLMRYSTGYTENGDWPEGFHEGGGMVLHALEDIATAREDIKAQVSALKASGYTPLAETLYEAGLYYMGMPVHFGLDSWVGDHRRDDAYSTFTPSVPESRNGDVYKNPTHECQKNFIVLLTDGLPTYDVDANPLVPQWPDFGASACTDNTGWDEGGEDGDCLDDIAGYLKDRDVHADESDGFQNVVTYTIGFFLDSELLRQTATLGGGQYYIADDADTLAAALMAIFQDVADIGSSFTAPSVSTNAYDSATHLDQLYFSLFKPDAGPHWEGNLKRYRAGDGQTDDGEMIVLDAENAIAVDPETGFFREGTRSFWSAAPDGSDVAAGGAVSLLTTDRQVVTQTDTGALVAVSENNRNVLTKELLGITGQSDDYHIKLLKWARGIDVDDVDRDGSTTDARQSMGDPLHAKPLLVTYGPGPDDDGTDPDMVVYMGTNDGYLHAFETRTGRELFAFIPRELLPHLDVLYRNSGTDKVYGVDGPLTAWVQDGGDGEVDSGDHVYLYVGLRRGGNHYYALDVTRPDAPTFMWSISPTTSGYGKLGQSWSRPVLARVETGSDTSPQLRDVLVFGGGYDTRQDGYSPNAPDSSGNAIYLADARTGELVWSGSDAGATANFPDMTNAIPATVRVLDLDVDGLADRMYVGDLGGRVWRFDVHNPTTEGTSFSITGGAIASLGGAESDAATANRRFYYAPDVAIGSADGETFLNITIGSGYREQPKDTVTDDHFYVIRDYEAFTALGVGPESDDDYVEGYGITHELLPTLQDGNSLPADAPGFKLPLNAATGEKVLAESRIFQNVAYFTSFAPEQEVQGDACFAYLGAGRMYAVDLGSGAVDEELLDRPGVPPEPVFMFEEMPQPETQPSDCFGPQCTSPPPPCEGDECPQQEPPGRDVGCLVGPERCDAGQMEVPVRTFWTQVIGSE